MKKKIEVIKRKLNNKMDQMEVDKMYYRLVNLIQMLFIHQLQLNQLKIKQLHLLLLKVLPKMIKNNNNNKIKIKKKMKKK